MDKFFFKMCPLNRGNFNPERIELSDEQIRQLEENLRTNNLSSSDQELILKLIKWARWVDSALKLKGLSLKRLRRIIFGSKTEKPASDKNKEPKVPPSKDKSNSTGSTNGGGGKGGKTPSSDFTGVNREVHKHESLSPGQSCPDCGKGTLYEYRPSIVMTFKGQAPVSGTKHECQRLRCSACGKIFSPKILGHLQEHKWDQTVAVSLAIMHYWMGLPFYRLERFQKMIGAPLPKSTQWDLVEKLARPCLSVYYALKKYAANGQILYNDDTGAVIQSVKCAPKKIDERKGVFSTAMVGVRDGREVSIFVTSQKHAGDNLKEMISLRDENLDKVMTMNDAASRAMPKDLVAEICNCLAHGRRNFYDLVEDFPREVKHVLKLMSVAYKTDLQARNQVLNPDERLAYHQQKSQFAMDRLWRWCHKMIRTRKIEPNSGLGKAIKYLLKHWKKLIKFLSIPGAPLDNNICERLVKVMIRYRKNSLMFKTETGAIVG
jgi:transposase